MQSDLSKILLSVASCDAAMSALPADVREAILAVKSDAERLAAEEREREAAREKARAKARAKEEAAERKRRADLLCIGSWGERVPLNRRFALCSRLGKEFVGWLGQERDPSKWKTITEYCAIDLVRGFTSPYWGYYKHYRLELDAWYNKRLKPVLEATTDDERESFIQSEYNFFKYSDFKYSDDEPKTFRVLQYEIDADGHVTVTGSTEPMTLAEHQAALKAEFTGESE